MTRRIVAALFALALAALGPAHAADPSGADDGAASGALDGQVFVSRIDVDSYDAPFEDRISFRDGMFYSEECQHACDFGWTPYYTREVADGIAFFAEYVCPTSPQTVRWEGVVRGDSISGTAHWTIERFYWTVERHGTWAGTAEAPRPAGADGREQASLTPE